MSILLKFYKQLLCAYIPKAWKDTDDLTEFLHFLGATWVIAVCKYVEKIDPWILGLKLWDVSAENKYLSNSAQPIQKIIICEKCFYANCCYLQFNKTLP